MTTQSKKFRVAEIFGPTIQGEGRNVGMPCHFVRFGGCDFRCEWCDTPHAVLPDLVSQLPKMDEWDIISKLSDLDARKDSFGNQVANPKWIVLTGGNPGLLNLTRLITLLHTDSRKVMLETQGTTYRSWYTMVDDLCFSPKPPSSKMDWNFDLFDRILGKLWTEFPETKESDTWFSHHKPYLKVPVFTYEDLEFAKKVHRTWPQFEMFISIGNDDPTLPTVGKPNPIYPMETDLTRDRVLDNFKDWTEVHLLHQELADVRIFPQQHTLIWGNERGH